MPHNPLLLKMADGTITETEKRNLYAWLAWLSEEDYAQVFEEYQTFFRSDRLPPYQSQWLDRLHTRIHNEEADIRQLHRQAKLRTLLVRLSAAALLTAVVTAAWLNYGRPPAKSAAALSVPILAGGQGAILTLSDGRSILLDSVASGDVAKENGTTISLANHRLQYTAGSPALVAASGASPADLAFNTVTVPKGRQFHLLLADGTGVWLNAASSIRFPAAFAGSERKVQVSGEVYLEVAPAKNQAFLVETDDRTTLQVLGTSFNIQAWPGEATRTITLLDGKVRVSNPDIAPVILQPGQQAVQAKNRWIVQPADTEGVLAWKNGLFNFENAGVREVMQQLERWYGVEVRYPKGIPDLHFVGYMPRDLPLQEVLKGLQGADLHISIEEGRTLVVLP